MGNCFSDPSGKTKHSGGQKLGSGPAAAASTSTGTAHQPAGATANGRARQTNTEPPRTLGGTATGGAVGADGGARDRALQAAEERANAAKKKGVTATNAKSGQLSAKLEAERKAARSPTARDEERMMDRGQWN